MPADNSANLCPLVSRELIGNKIGKALSIYVGRGKRFTIKELMRGTGVSDRLIECAMYPVGHVDYRHLKAEHIFSLMGFLGADFTSDVLALVAQGAFDLPEDGDPPPGELAADDISDSAEIARRAADGNFDGEDRKHLRAVGRRKVERGMVLVGLADAA